MPPFLLIVVINFQFMYVVVKAWGNIIIGDDDVVWELPAYVRLSMMVMQVALASGVTLDHQSNEVVSGTSGAPRLSNPHN